MSRKVLAFAASNSSVSINRQFVEYAASLLGEGDEVEFLDIHDYEMPLYRHDRELADGIPQQARDFRAKIASADALLIALAEHNGTYSAAFKNLFDWSSRLGRDVWAGKPIVMLSAAPGSGGAQSVLGFASGGAHFFEGDVKATMSVPNFGDAFDSEAGKLRDEAQVAELKAALAKL